MLQLLSHEGDWFICWLRRINAWFPADYDFSWLRGKWKEQSRYRKIAISNKKAEDVAQRSTRVRKYYETTQRINRIIECRVIWNSMVLRSCVLYNARVSIGRLGLCCAVHPIIQWITTHYFATSFCGFKTLSCTYYFLVLLKPYRFVILSSL